ncbi:hypothetical protein BH10PSE3_BH10PSE3_17640 [soil metagenome]
MSSFEILPSPAYDSAPTITVVDEEIVILGPGSVAFSMTREAAWETHRRLGLALAPSDEAASRRAIGE